MSKQFDYSKHLRTLFPSKNKGMNRLILGLTVRFTSSSSINGSDLTHEYKLMPLSCGRWYCDEALRFCHVVA